LKRYIASAVIIALTTLAIHPFLNELALLERGYQAIGGEEMVVVMGFFAAFLVLNRGLERKRNAGCSRATRISTESEQSDNHFDA